MEAKKWRNPGLPQECLQLPKTFIHWTESLLEIIMSIRLFPLDHLSTPKSCHGDLILVVNAALPYAHFWLALIT